MVVQYCAIYKLKIKICKNKYMYINISYLKTCGLHLIREICLIFLSKYSQNLQKNCTTSENSVSCYTGAVDSFILIF